MGTCRPSSRPGARPRAPVSAVRVGLISDTHGLLRPQAVAFLQGCAHIVHGGDIGNAGILEELSKSAPVSAVRGNNDVGTWAAQVPEQARVQVADVLIHVLHDLSQLDFDPAAAGVRVVVSGHSHKPSIAERGGVLYVNPGSAGPRRFRLPVAVGELQVRGNAVEARIVELDIAR